jgi:bifunctional non-homologous end joining protein LigD
LASVPFQLASHGKSLPSGPEWTFERKYDGYRAQLSSEAGVIRVHTRGGLDWTHRFPTIVEAARRRNGDFILDGEICALAEDGRTSFSWLGTPSAHGARLCFMAFDLLHLCGANVRDKALFERRALLAKFLEPAEREVISAVHSEDGSGEALHASTLAAGHEGIIAKRLDAPYRNNRTRDWLKFKHRKTETFAVIGWHEDAKNQFTSLILASTDPHPVFRGRVGTGFSATERRRLQEALRRNSAEHCSYDVSTPPQVYRSAHWVNAALSAKVEYLELSSAGMAREPRFLGLVQA